MINVPQKLREIITQHGRCVLDDTSRCEGLLKDYCGEQRREIAALVSALKERVPADLLTWRPDTPLPQEMLLARLTRRLQDNLGLTEELARWAVEAWALALGISIIVKEPDNTNRGTDVIDESKKKCPDCAEWVHGEARKCRFCGHEFPPVPGASLPVEPSPAPEPGDDTATVALFVVFMALFVLSAVVILSHLLTQ